MGRPISLAAIVGLLLLGSVSSTAQDEGGFNARFRALTSEDVLSPGPPALHRGDVDAFVDLFEAAFDLALPRSDELALRDAIETRYGTWDGAARRAFLDLVASRGEMRRLAREGDAAGIEDGLMAFRRDLDRRLAAAGDEPWGRILREVLRRRGDVVWPGRPPLNAATAAAWLEIGEFVVSLARNEDVEPTVGQRSVVQEDLVAALQDVDEATRDRVARAHQTWLRTKAIWDGADEARRFMLRYRALELLVRMLPEDRRITVEGDGDLAAFLRASSLLRGLQSDYEAWSNLVRHPGYVLDLLETWLGADATASSLLVR